LHRRFSRWAQGGVWDQIFETLTRDRDNGYLMIDSTIVRAHQHAAGAKKWAADRQALGRSRGGLSTKIQSLVDALGHVVDIVLAQGQAANITAAHHLQDGRQFNGPIADRAYDADHPTQLLRQAGIDVVIPSTRSRQIAVQHDCDIYKQRNRIERFFCRLKQVRAIATRHDKRANHFVAAVRLAAAIVSPN